MSEDLSRYRWHTGAAPRPLDPLERCPVLFRDLGPAALATYLRGQLTRLAGPWTPLTYCRTFRWEEPYVDHARTGRLAFLDGRGLGVWHSGVEHVFVARATRDAPAGSAVYVPGDVSLARAAALLEDAKDEGDARAAFGGALHDERRAHDLDALDRLESERLEVDEQLRPLVRRLRAGQPEARAQMRALDVDERDLSAAWHHLAADRRARLLALARARVLT